MNKAELSERRLFNQGLSSVSYQQAQELVAHFGAVQAQDYAGAKWALAQRLWHATEAGLDQAFDAGQILRTHVMRPTWHFVAPQDLRWLLALTGSRVHAASAYMYRRLELDSTLFKRAQRVLEKALRDENHLTRDELTATLKASGFQAEEPLRFTYLIMSGEIDGLICSGPRRGKQFTYALLEERLQPSRKLDRSEALAELTRRYFRAHGPATLGDFVWWSGLSAADAKIGLELVKPELTGTIMDGQTYWFVETEAAGLALKARAAAVHLLPDYDEYGVGYASRDLIYDNRHDHQLDGRGSFLAQYIIVIAGQVVGTWKRTLKQEVVQIELHPFRPLTQSQQGALRAAAERYGKYLGKQVEYI